jgi:hypothetical protein
MNKCKRKLVEMDKETMVTRRGKKVLRRKTEKERQVGLLKW